MNANKQEQAQKVLYCFRQLKTTLAEFKDGRQKALANTNLEMAFKVYVAYMQNHGLLEQVDRTAEYKVLDFDFITEIQLLTSGLFFDMGESHHQVLNNSLCNYGILYQTKDNNLYELL